MKKLLKRAAKFFLNPFIEKLGYIDGNLPDSYSKASLLHTLYSTLQTLQFKPKHIVDVGANHGTWTREALTYFPDANFTLLEPQSSMRESIIDILQTNTKVNFNPIGAGEKEGSFMFTLVDRDDSCSFNYTTKEAEEKGFRQIEIPVVTLNNFLPKTKLPIPDIIKIDAEGLDIEVLKGGSDYFGKTEIFMVEAGVVNKNFKNNLLNVITFMDDNGYRLFEITDLNRPFKIRVLWLVELVFIKKDGIIDSQSFV